VKGKINYSQKEMLAIVKNNGFMYDHSTGGHDIYVRGKEKLSLVARGTNAMVFRRLMKEHNLKEVY